MHFAQDLSYLQDWCLVGRGAIVFKLDGLKLFGKLFGDFLFIVEYMEAAEMHFLNLV